MSRPVNQKPLALTVSPAHTYTDRQLGQIVTRAEVKVMWKKAFTTIDLELAKGNLQGRKSLSGGAVLITFRSAFDLWGSPKDTTLLECYNGKDELSRITGA